MPSTPLRLALALPALANLFTAAAVAETLTVQPGESIQAAVRRAQAGDVIRVMPAPTARPCSSTRRTSPSRAWWWTAAGR